MLSELLLLLRAALVQYLQVQLYSSAAEATCRLRMLCT
jgi:hypothetical protein